MRIFTVPNDINFLEETIKCLQYNGRTEADVLWVGRGFGILLSDEPYKICPLLTEVI